MKKGIKNNAKHKPISHNENLKQKSENPKTSPSEMNNSKARNDPLESPLRSLSSRDTASTNPPSPALQETKTHIIKITDFNFSPKQIKITCKSTLRWIVCENVRNDAGIYYGEERKFVISIDEIGIESEQLIKGQHFDHVFEYSGEYTVKGNYPRMTCKVEVYDDEEDLKSSLHMNYHERFNTNFMKKEEEKVVVHKEQNPQKEFKLNRKDIEEDNQMKQLIKNLSYEKLNKSNKSKSLCEGSDEEPDKHDPFERYGNNSIGSYDETNDFLIQECEEGNTSLRLEKNLTGERELDVYLGLNNTHDFEKSNKEHHQNQNPIHHETNEDLERERLFYEKEFIESIALEKIEEVANEHSIDMYTEQETDKFTKFVKTEMPAIYNDMIPSYELTEDKKQELIFRANCENFSLDSRLLAMKRFLDNRYLFEESLEDESSNQ